MKRFPFTAPLLAAALLAPAALHAQEAKESKKPAKAEQKRDAAAEQDAMMKAWMAAATPGEAHKKLDPMVGSWTAHVKSWMAPGAPAMESDATAEFAWVLGNRFVEEKFHGQMMGQPFEGIGYSGYDNVKKKFFGVWMDNMTTAAMTMWGGYDKEGKKLTSAGTMDDPYKKKAAKVKSVATNPDADHMQYDMWGEGPDGKMFKTLEIVYTRKK